MKNKFLILSALTLISACSMEQQPAPVEQYSAKFYGRDQMNVSSDYIGGNNTPAPVASSSSSKNQRHYSGYNPNAYASGGTNSFLAGSNNVTAKKLEPVAIDSDENVVNVNSKKTPNNVFQQRAEFGNNPASVPTPPAMPQQTANAADGIKPVVKDSKTEYLDLAKVSAPSEQKAADDKLASIKPIAKPEYKEKVEEPKVAEAKPEKIAPPKIVPTIQKVETSSGAAKPDTNLEIAKTQAADDYAKKEMAEIRAQEAKKPAEPVASISSDIANIEKKAPDNNKPAEKKAEPVKEAAKEAPKKEEVKEVAKKEEVKPKAVEVADANSKAIEEIKKEEPKTVSVKKFIKPVDGIVVSEFGAETAGKYNDGITIQAPEGTPVKAAAGGTVVYSGNQLQGYGNLVILRHQDGFLTAYSHLQGLDLKKGDKVGQGDVIGRVGKSGNVDTPQLHFGVRKGREPVNPKDYL